MRVILGIDPGSVKTGWGVIALEGSTPHYRASGILKLGQGTMAERLLILHDGLSDVLATYAPNEAAIEEVFLAKNCSQDSQASHLWTGSSSQGAGSEYGDENIETY